MQTSAALDVTRRLARFTVETKPADIPDAVRHEARRALLNWLGCAIGGCRHPAVETALAALAQFSGPPQASVLGRAERLDILHAALVNGIGSHVLDFDDTQHPTLIHPSGPVVPAALALAEKERAGGEALVHAIVIGIDVACRVGRTVFPAHYRAGWHITGTAGVFGAAAAAGALLRLSEQEIAWALGLAATQSAGLREMFGTMGKSFHPGRAAQNGLTAAFLAHAGFTSSERAIEAPAGFAHVLSGERDLSRALEGLGERFELMTNTYKPYACGLVIHPAIDGCLELRELHELRGPEIARVHLGVNRLALELTGNKSPRNGLEAKFSVFHSAAIALVAGAAGEPQYADAAVRDPAVVALREKITAEVVSHLAETQGTVRIELNDGRVLETKVAHATGSPERPMTDVQLEAKFEGLAGDILDRAAVRRLIDLCRSADRLEDAGDLARASVPRT
jgi:2-methylcitrate dehydratase PrpD